MVPTGTDLITACRTLFSLYDYISKLHSKFQNIPGMLQKLTAVDSFDPASSV
jgi:hypothetical protein